MLIQFGKLLEMSSLELQVMNLTCHTKGHMIYLLQHFTNSKMLVALVIKDYFNTYA